MPPPSGPQLYAEQLMPRGYGLPLWKPEPPRTGEIDIGDVGFLQNGRFCRLFNAMRAANDPINELGVPARFRPLLLPVHLLDENEDFLPEGPIYNKRSVHLKVSGGLSASTVPASAEASYVFSCSNSRGAVAVLGSTGKMSQVWRNWTIPAYIADNSASWHAFAIQQGYYIQSSDIILVSGFVKASEWGIAAFSSDEQCHDVSFIGRVGSFASAHFGVSINDDTSPFIEQRCGPSRARGEIPEGIPPMKMPKDQCLFLSYYKQKLRGPLSFKTGVKVTTKGTASDAWTVSDRRLEYAYPNKSHPQVSRFMARLWHKGAGMSRKTSRSLVSGMPTASERCEGLAEDFEEVPNSAEIPDVLDDLLDFILENSGAKVAIACHRDLYAIWKPRKRSLNGKDDLPSYLRKVMPSINVDERGFGTIGTIPRKCRSAKDFSRYTSEKSHVFPVDHAYLTYQDVGLYQDIRSIAHFYVVP